MRKKIALILAGGIGQRMDSSLPKQFIKVNNKPIMIHTLEKFQSCSEIDSIVIVCLKDYVPLLEEYINIYSITKLEKIVHGGKNAMYSILNGLEYIRNMYNDDDLIIIHESVRPLINQEIILDSLRIASIYHSAISAIPCYEGIMYSTDGKTSDTLLGAQEVFRDSLPNSFSVDYIYKLYCKGKEQGILELYSSTTPLMRDLKEKFYFSKGSVDNFKITTQDDLKRFEAFLNVK